METTGKRNRNIQNLLMEAAIRHIEKHGVNKISLRKISADCGVTHATVYKYYENKKAFINATIPYILSNMYPYLRRALKNAPDEEPFVVLCKSYVRYMVKHPQYHYLLHPGTLNAQPAWPVPSPIERSPYFDHPYIKIAEDFFSRCKVQEQEYSYLFPLLSSMINGLILLLNRKLLVFHGDFGDLVDIIIFQPLKLKPRRRRKSN